MTAPIPSAGPAALPTDGKVVPALELRDLHKRFGRTDVVCGASLAVAAGERVAIIGPNGAGKSTLFNLASGRFAPDRGQVLLNGRRVDGLPPFEINRLGLARSFQVTQAFGQMSVFDNLRCAVAWSQGLKYSFLRLLSHQHRANALVAEWLERLHLSHRREVPAGQLSYAEQRALELGLTLAGGAPVVLLDEPTAGMSSSETERFVALIRTVTTGRTLVMVEHDMGVVFDLADRIAVLEQGRFIAFDRPAAIRANAAVQEAYLGSVSATVAQAGRP